MCQPNKGQTKAENSTKQVVSAQEFIRMHRAGEVASEGERTSPVLFTLLVQLRETNAATPQL